MIDSLKLTNKKEKVPITQPERVWLIYSMREIKNVKTLSKDLVTLKFSLLLRASLMVGLISWPLLLVICCIITLLILNTKIVFNRKLNNISRILTILTLMMLIRWNLLTLSWRKLLEFTRQLKLCLLEKPRRIIKLVIWS